MSGYTVRDELSLWWLAQPASPRRVGTLRFVPRRGNAPAGVSLEYDPGWLRSGQALSDDLPLRSGEFLPLEPGSAVGAVDDARPDRWGERVIRLLDRPARLSTLEFLYFAGDDRFGALGVSASAQAYEPRRHGAAAGLADVPTMLELVRQVEAGETVDERLWRLITPGATLGGARPKALLQMDGAQWVLKFAEAGDVFDAPLVEHATMTLARRAGIRVCETRPIPLGAAGAPGAAGSGHAVAVRRFDRAAGERLHALSAHVLLRAAGQPFGYPELALELRRRGPSGLIEQQGEELFRRMVFNILLDNTDDHEKNHAVLVDARQQYVLSPAFDILPAAHGLGYQQLRVGREGARASLANAESECRSFALAPARARQLVQEVQAVAATWREHFRGAGVRAADIECLAPCIDQDRRG